VVINHSVPQSHPSELDGTPKEKFTHKHEDFQEVHHDHHFHVGIFHFLGHLFENINHSNDHVDKHSIVVQKTSVKKFVANSHVFNAYFNGITFEVIVVDTESLPDPPYFLKLLQKLKLRGTSLRAPPTLV
jgi:hypothetical protein